MTPVFPPFIDIYAALDLGKVSDYSALAILKRTGNPLGHYHYVVTALQRAELGTSYPKIVDSTRETMSQPIFRPQRCYPASADGPTRLEWAPLPTLAIDATGVGVAVVDLFVNARLPVTLAPVTITSGGQSRKDKWPNTHIVSHYVPKIELVGTVQAALQTGRLKFAAGLDLAETVKKELRSFEVKTTQSANETYGSWRENSHDDLVLAICMALWLAEFREPVHHLMVTHTEHLSRRWGALPHTPTRRPQR